MKLLGGTIRNTVWAVTAGFIAIVISPAIKAQNSTPLNDDPIAQIIDIRKQMLKANEENIDILSTFMFNLTYGAICIDDVNSINDDASDHISKIVASDHLVSGLTDAQIKTLVTFNIKSEINLLTDDLVLKRKRLHIDAPRGYAGLSRSL